MDVSHPSREQLFYLLHEAAEIEHNLMCCYLYAAFSLKQTDVRWTPEQAKAVAGWRRSITSIALEEMTHLGLVANLQHAIGGQPHFNRPPFPVESGPYPADFVIRLQPFGAATIDHFRFLERPHGADLPDGQGFAPRRRYRRGVSPDRLSPGARDYATVGDLYATLREGLQAFAAEAGEAALFVGDPALQVDASVAPLPGLRAVADLAGAMDALDTIVHQGEGAGSENPDSHFCRFTRIAAELELLADADPAFVPAWPAATNPVMNPPPQPDGKVFLDHPENARWLDIGNALYTTSLRCLLQGFGARERSAKSRWLASSFALMRALLPVGHGLAARPARADAPQPHGGLTFTPLRSLSLLPEGSAARIVAARLRELRDRAAELPVKLVDGEAQATWPAVIATLEAEIARIAGAEGTSRPAPAVGGAAAVPVTVAPAASVPAPSAAAVAAAASPLEEVRTPEVTILFEGARCIHARHCVLQAPTVFLANTPGEWIHPETMAVEKLVAVAEQCPSGAIRYRRHDGKAEEAPPPVNVLRIRENGPYAVHAALVVAGLEDGFRATLCRCGQSKRKPYCDGSHVAAKFAATGEPPTTPSEALADRAGALAVTPLRNGPLHVAGNLELCAGTGRTVAKLGAPNAPEARLCRCGQSRNKPFCDGSHVGAGFVAEGT